MAKELPYYKFYIGEWLNGDITIEDFECQGIFINICAYYWQKDGDLSLEVVNKRFRSYPEQIKQLIKSNLIKVVGENISISFLNEQMESKEIQKITNQKNGAKGGRPRKEETEKKPIRLFSETETKANENPNKTNIEEIKEEENKKEDIIISDDQKKLIEDIAVFFEYTSPNNHVQQSLIWSFVYSLPHKQKLDFFIKEFSAYCKLKELDGYKHKLENFLGDQKDQFKNGKWDDNWSVHLAAYKKKNNITDQKLTGETALKRHRRKLQEREEKKDRT